MSAPRTASRRVQWLAVLGAVAVAAAAGVLYLSFLATNGLPWASTYNLGAEVPNAERLAPNDDVRIAGVRVGRVSSVSVTLDAGAPHARIGLKLDDAHTRLASDTRVRIRQASVLGASYVDLQPGTGATKLADGATLPLAQAQDAVQVTDLLDIFDRATARNIRASLRDASTGFAGRGASLNATFAALPGALLGLTHVARSVASTPAHFGRFLRGWERFAAALEPARAAFAGIMAGGSRTFGALDSERLAVGRTIDLAPSAERAVSAGLDAVRPGLRSLAATMAILRPQAPRFEPALREGQLALTAGSPVMRRLPSVADRLTSTFDTLSELVRAPSTDGAVRKTTDLFAALGTTLDVLTPSQVTCNIVTLWAENFANGFGGLGFGDGPAMASVFITHNGASNEGSQNAAPSPNVAINNLPHENSRECEAGNEPYDGKQLLVNPPGLQSRHTRDTRPPAGVRALAAKAGLLAGDGR